MKKLLPFLLCVLLCACTRTSLTDTVTAAIAADESLPAGNIFIYGRQDSTVDDGFMTDYLGCAGYPEFLGKIEELALYVSLNGDYCELCVLRMYDAADTADAVLFLERRITEAKRALTVMGKTGYADTAFVQKRGNLVALFMLPDNESIKKQVF